MQGNAPRVLLLDIETAPALVWTWGLHDVSIGIEQIVQPGRIICWGAKWLGEREVHYADERRNPKKMFEAAHALMSEADAFVSYNGDSFDLPKLNGAFLEHGLSPLPPIASIDLYKTVKKLGYQSNKLAFIAPHLKVGEKVKHEGFGLWAACLKGDKKAWVRMQKYNIQDVRLLEPLYLLLRPYIRNHPYLGTGVTNLGTGCPACGSFRAQARGNRRTKAYLIGRLMCLRCNTWYDGAKHKIRCAAAA